MRWVLIWVGVYYLIWTVQRMDTAPMRENAEWSMLLCKYKDSNWLPHNKEWYINWLTNDTADGSIAYYFRHVSNGIYTTSRSTVHGWFEIPYTKKQAVNLGNQDKEIRDAVDPARRIYVKTKQLCLQYAKDVLNIPISNTRRVITVINDEDTAVFCLAYGVLVTPRFMITAAVVHEMSHSFNLGHSYSDLDTQVFSQAEPGEYDDKYDLMSTANAHMYTSPQFGQVGPGLNGPNLDYLGWLPAYRLYFFGKSDSDKARETIIRISSLSRPHHQTADWLLILIPYDREDPLKVYTVELRTRELLDIAIPKPALIIHQISRRENGIFLYSKILHQRDGENPTYELTNNGEEWKVGLDNKFGSRFIKVKLDWIDETSGTAQIVVSSDFSPTACSTGEVQREAVQSDIPCISVKEKNEIQRQNKRSQNGLLQSINGKCLLPGLVPRKANPDDDVCVSTVEREEVRRQNEKWREYREFYTRPTFGLNSCKRGYTWRQIDPYDYACVEEGREKEWEKENELHENRRTKNPVGRINECKEGFVWRNAIASDETCVTSEEHRRAQFDNQRNVERLMYTKFFNADNKLQP